MWLCFSGSESDRILSFLLMCGRLEILTDMVIELISPFVRFHVQFVAGQAQCKHGCFEMGGLVPLCCMSCKLMLTFSLIQPEDLVNVCGEGKLVVFPGAAMSR